MAGAGLKDAADAGVVGPGIATRQAKGHVPIKAIVGELVKGTCFVVEPASFVMRVGKLALDNGRVAGDFSIEARIGGMLPFVRPEIMYVAQVGQFIMPGRNDACIIGLARPVDICLERLCSITPVDP